MTPDRMVRLEQVEEIVREMCDCRVGAGCAPLSYSHELNCAVELLQPLLDRLRSLAATGEMPWNREQDARWCKALLLLDPKDSTKVLNEYLRLRDAAGIEVRSLTPPAAEKEMES